jgi:hypothetical protein
MINFTTYLFNQLFLWFFPFAPGFYLISLVLVLPLLFTFDEVKYSLLTMDMLLTLAGASESRNLPIDAVSVSDFVREAWDDYNSPTTSNFVSRMGHYRATAVQLEEVGGA